MLTLDAAVQLPAHVSFAFVREQAVLLNMKTNHYYRLDEVGARFWGLLREGKSLRGAYQGILGEYQVEPARLEQDLLELLAHLQENGLVEITPA